MLTAVEAAMSQWGLTLHQALWEFPLAALLALWVPMAERLGGGGDGPDIADRAGIEARQRCRRWLQKHFEIIPTPKQPNPPRPIARP